MLPTPKIDHDAVVHYIEDRRKDLGLSIRAMCERAGVHEDTYGNITRGKSSFMSCTYLLGIAKALEIPFDELARRLMPDVDDWHAVFPDADPAVLSPHVADASPAVHTFDLSPLAAHMDAAHARIEEQLASAHGALNEQYQSTISDLRHSRRLLFWLLIGAIIVIILMVSLFAYVIEFDTRNSDIGYIRWQQIVGEYDAANTAYFNDL